MIIIEVINIHLIFSKSYVVESKLHKSQRYDFI